MGCRICAPHPGLIVEQEVDHRRRTIRDTGRLVSCFCQRLELAPRPAHPRPKGFEVTNAQ